LLKSMSQFRPWAFDHQERPAVRGRVAGAVAKDDEERAFVVERVQRHLLAVDAELERAGDLLVADLAADVRDRDRRALRMGTNRAGTLNSVFGSYQARPRRSCAAANRDRRRARRPCERSSEPPVVRAGTPASKPRSPQARRRTPIDRGWSLRRTPHPVVSTGDNLIAAEWGMSSACRPDASHRFLATRRAVTFTVRHGRGRRSSCEAQETILR